MTRKTTARTPGLDRPKLHPRGFAARKGLAMALIAASAFLSGAAITWSLRPDPAANIVKAILKGEAFADEE